MSLNFIALLTVFSLLILLAFGSSHGGSLSNLFLPGHVVAEKGEVTLFADYGSVQADGRVPVYLINWTDDDIILNTQDGDIYLKLQFQDNAGNWVRAQPHAYSFCGNSYIQRTVKAGHYLLVKGFQPADGVPKTVRYTLYSQDVAVSSNAGFGMVSEDDIRRASTDVMSIYEGSFDYVSSVALSQDPVQNNMDHMRDLRQMAIFELASDRFDADQSRRVLEQVRIENPAMTSNVDQALGRLHRR